MLTIPILSNTMSQHDDPVNELTVSAGLQLFGLQQAAKQGKLGLCVPDLPVPLPTQDNFPQA